MGISWRDVFRGLGDAATYISDSMKEERETEAEEKRELRSDLRRFNYEKRLRGYMHKLSMKQEEYSSKLQMDRDVELQKQRDDVELFGSMETANTIRGALKDGTPLTQAVAVHKINLMNKISGGETDLTPDEEMLLQTQFGANAQVYFKQVLGNSRRINEKFDLDKQVAEGRVREISSIINLNKARIDQMKRNPDDRDPLVLKNSFATLKMKIIENFKTPGLSEWNALVAKKGIEYARKHTQNAVEFEMMDAENQTMMGLMDDINDEYKKVFGSDILEKGLLDLPEEPGAEYQYDVHSGYPDLGITPKPGESQKEYFARSPQGLVKKIGKTSGKGWEEMAEKAFTSQRKKVRSKVGEGKLQRAQAKADRLGINAMSWEEAQELADNPDTPIEDILNKYFTNVDGHVYKFVRSYSSKTGLKAIRDDHKDF